MIRMIFSYDKGKLVIKKREQLDFKNRIIAYFFIAALLLSALVAAQAQQTIDNILIEKDGSVMLPAERNTSIAAYDLSKNAALTKLISEFNNRHGEWSFQIDPLTGTPRRAIGKSFKIKGYESISAENIELASMKFLSENSELLGVNVTDLKLKRKHFVRDRWYVTYSQTYKGIDVMLSEIELRIFKNGNVMAFGSVFYKDINLNTEASISYAQAAESAALGLTINPKTDKVQASTKKYILPVRQSGKIDYKLVYSASVEALQPYAKFVSYVDAHTGDLVWRRNQIFNAQTTLESTGEINFPYSYSPKQTKPLKFQYISVGDTEIKTDENGKAEVNIDAKANVTARLEGEYVKVLSDRTVGNFSGIANPGENIQVLWNNQNSHIYERNQYFNANYIHDYIKKIDPDMTAMDFQLEVTVNFEGQQPNAYSGGKEIAFIGAGLPDYFFAATPSILFHEYGHSINFLLYMDLGVEEGMMNLSTHEGTADLLACLVLDTPEIGRGAFGDDSNHVIRNLDNNLVYPDDLQSDSHHNGMILGGAFWDLRMATSNDYVAHLSHFTKYGLPDDPDIGIAFGEWFVETLIADDDDGDLSNGTPYSDEIIEAFDRHQIGFDLYYMTSFSHTPYEDTKQTEEPYLIEFQLATQSIAGNKLDSVMVVYSTDNFLSAFYATATSDGGGIYKAYIPAQPAGKIVKYYMIATNHQNSKKLSFTSNFGRHIPFNFLVGYNSCFFDNFDKNRGWVTGSSSDNASQGAWQNAIPDLVDLDALGMGGGIFQPNGGRTSNKCWVTGKTGGFSFYQNYLSGRSTVTSPKYDLSKLENPVIRFYKWFKSLLFMGQSKTYMKVQYTGNGTTWHTIDSSEISTEDWLKVQFLVPEDDQFSTVFQIRIIADNPPSSSNISMVEALFDDFEILTTNDYAISSVEDGIDEMNKTSSYPNPFSENVTISFYNSNAISVNLTIINELGETIATRKIDNPRQGLNNIGWDGAQYDGSIAAPGMYFYIIDNGVEKQTGKLIKF